MEIIQWKPGDVAIDPKGTRWRVIAVDDGNIFEYPELGVELLNSPALPVYRDVISSRMLKKED